MLAQFYYNPVKVGVDDEGVDNYVDRVFIKITRDITHTVNRLASQEDFERFPAEYRYFEKATAEYEPLESGLPIEMWPIATPSDVMNLKGHTIRTVQELAKAKLGAGVPPNFITLAGYAKDYVRIAGEASKITEMSTRLTEENKMLRDEIHSLKGVISQLRSEAAKEKAA